jgi:hypothetical protein
VAEQVGKKSIRFQACSALLILDTFLECSLHKHTSPHGPEESIVGASLLDH